MLYSYSQLSRGDQYVIEDLTMREILDRQETRCENVVDKYRMQSCVLFGYLSRSLC